MERWIGIVADTDRTSASAIKRALAALDCNVICVSSTEGLDAAIEIHRTALIIVSTALHGLDASRLCRRIRTAADCTYYLMFRLEERTPGAITAAFEAGAEEVLAKPLTAVELRARFKHAKRILALEKMRETIATEGAWLAEIAATKTFHSLRYLQGQLAKEVARSQRFLHSLSLLLAEVHHDDKGIMGKFGHLLSGQLRGHVDWVARCGDRRIAIVLPETNLGGALRVAGRILLQLDATTLRAAGLPAFSVNFGVSALGSDSQLDWEALLESASGYLNDALRKGSNQIAGGPAPRS